MSFEISVLCKNINQSNCFTCENLLRINIIVKYIKFNCRKIYKCDNNTNMKYEHNITKYCTVKKIIHILFKSQFK